MGCTKYANIIEGMRRVARHVPWNWPPPQVLRVVLMENNKGMSGSPCSPPSACVTNLCLPSASTQEYVEGVPWDSRQHGLGCGHVHKSLEHCGPQRVVVCANPVHAQDRREVRVCGIS